MWFKLSQTWQLSCSFVPRGMYHEMLHVINVQCVEHDLHTIGPGSLERTCRRWFAAQSGDCKKILNYALCDYHYYYYICSMCWAWFAHDWTRVTWAYVSEMICSTVRRLYKNLELCRMRLLLLLYYICYLKTLQSASEKNVKINGMEKEKELKDE